MDGNVALVELDFHLLSGLVGYIYLLLTLGACKRDNNRGKFSYFLPPDNNKDVVDHEKIT